jgi:hypothetical protein
MLCKKMNTGTGTLVSILRLGNILNEDALRGWQQFITCFDFITIPVIHIQRRQDFFEFQIPVLFIGSYHICLMASFFPAYKLILLGTRTR